MCLELGTQMLIIIFIAMVRVDLDNSEIQVLLAESDPLLRKLTSALKTGVMSS